MVSQQQTITQIGHMQTHEMMRVSPLTIVNKLLPQQEECPCFQTCDHIQSQGQ